MLQGLATCPMVCSHSSDCSTLHVWEDELGDPQMIPLEEGGEQGDPCPLCSALPNIQPWTP